MRYVLSLLLVLFGLVGVVPADEWKEIQRLESTGEITWMDVSRHGDRVAYVCDWHDGYLYNTKKEKTFPLVPPKDSRNKLSTGFVSNAVFLGDTLVTHGGMGKHLWTADGKLVKSTANQILLEVGLPKFAFTKDQKGERVLFYLPPLKEGDPLPAANSNIRSFVYIVAKNGLKSSFVHAPDVKNALAARVDAVAITSDGDYAFTAGGGFVTRWTMGAISESEGMNIKRKRGSFDLPSGEVVAIATAQDAVVVAMKHGQVIYDRDMKDPVTLSVDSALAAETSSGIVNHGLAMSADGSSTFVARTRLTNKSESVHEVVMVGFDKPYKQMFVGKSEIIKVQLVDESTLICLTKAGLLGIFSIKSGAVQAEPQWFKTGLSDAQTFVFSGGTLVVYGSRAGVIYHHDGGKEKLTAVKQ